MKITIVLGSVRRGRQSAKVGSFLKKMLAGNRAVVSLVDLAQTPLPIYGTQTENSQISYLGRLLGESDALLLVSPEYHGSFSGVLKNALDYFRKEFFKKPIGVVSVSTSKFKGINATSQLQHVILALGAYPLPLKLLGPEIHQLFDASLEPKGTFIRRTEKFIHEFLWFAEAIYQKKEQGKSIGAGDGENLSTQSFNYVIG